MQVALFLYCHMTCYLCLGLHFGPSLNPDTRYTGKALVTWEMQQVEERRGWKAGLPDDVHINTLIGRWRGNSAPYLMVLSEHTFRHFAAHGEQGMLNYWDELTVNLTSYFDRFSVRVDHHPALDDWAAAFMLFVCTLGEGQFSFCPDPCSDSPCVDKSVVPNSQCLTLRPGVRRHQYMCTCPFTYTWNYTTQTCDRVNVCQHVDLYPCYKPHTISCSLTANSFECECTEHGMGVTCELDRDPCYQSDHIDQPSGRQQCESTGGRCVPHLASTSYRCLCPDILDDVATAYYSYPSCQGTFDIWGMVWGLTIGLLLGCALLVAVVTVTASCRTPSTG